MIIDYHGRQLINHMQDLFTCHEAYDDVVDINFGFQSDERTCYRLKLRVMCLILNIIFSGVIAILAYKSTTAFRFTSWLLSVMNTSIKD